MVVVMNIEVSDKPGDVGNRTFRMPCAGGGLMLKLITALET
jgi:hypothetical protein